MQLTTIVQVQPQSPNALISLMRQFNAACNWLSKLVLEEKLFHWLPLQRRAYYELRQRFCLSSQAALLSIRKVAAVYKEEEKRRVQASFSPLGAIPLRRHRYKQDSTVSFYGFRIPFLARQGISLSSKHQAMLVYQNGKFFIHQVIEVPEPVPYQPEGFLGCDLGIANILADSDGSLYSGAQVNGLRHRFAKLRRRLQKKGTRSAKRLLRKRRRKERRFSCDVNHCISKQVVAKAYGSLRGIALEDLLGIRGRIKVKKAQRRQHHCWSFHQLRSFIEDKARLVGVPVVVVDPKNTSRTCPTCGLVDRANRKLQADFLCIGCGYAGPADVIAAWNIAHRAVVSGRANGDWPDVAA